MTEKFAPIFPSHIDNTMLTLYKACPYKFWLQQMRGVASPQPNIHLHFGGVFAKACEIVRRAYFLDNKPKEESITLGSEYILKNFGDWDEEEAGVKTMNNCIWALENYFREAYALDFDRFVPYRDSPSGKPMIEFSFAIPIDTEHPETGEPIMYAGRCDMIGADSTGLSDPSEAREVWLVDEKTTQQMGDKWARQWRLRGQFIGYTWAARQYNLPASGALVRGICLYKKKEPKFDQAFVSFNDSVIDRWHTQVEITIDQMIADWETGYWKQDFGDSCAEYGGCGFISMCELDDPEPFIQTKYVERRWDPLRQTEIEGAE